MHTQHSQRHDFKGRLAVVAALTAAWGLAGEARAQAVDSSLSFFVTGTSLGQGGNLGGLTGADAHCQQLAAGVGAGSKIWRAYLSTQASGGEPAVNARDRIGPGPWFNANKALVALNVADLHTTTALTLGVTQTGAAVSLSSPNQHDILTGTRADGTAHGAAGDSTCANWTSSTAGTGGAVVGHCNRAGGGAVPTSWNAAHRTTGCSQQNLVTVGGNGYFYCFADNTPVGIDLRRPPRGVGSVSDLAPYFLTGQSRGEPVVYRFALEKESRVEVSVFDTEGRRHMILLREKLGAGSRAVRWDGTDSRGAALPPGLYLIVLKRDADITAR